MEEPDPQLIEAAVRGGLGAFEELVRHYQPPVWRMCSRLLNERESAEDATQETFVRLYRFLPTFQGRSKFSTWLLSIARNCAADQLRSRAKQKRISLEVLELPPRTSQCDSSSDLEVREALQALPEELREAVVLIDMLGMRYREAAVILNIPVGTLKSRVHRARDHLARVLGIEANPRQGEGRNHA